MSRDAFPGYEDPVNIDAEPKEALRVLLNSPPLDQTPRIEETHEAE
jgi:hypothetical protein